MATADEFTAGIAQEVGIKPEWAAEAFSDPAQDVRQSIVRIAASPFIPKTDAVRGFVFDVATGQLDEVVVAPKRIVLERSARPATSSGPPR